MENSMKTMEKAMKTMDKSMNTEKHGVKPQNKSMTTMEQVCKTMEKSMKTMENKDEQCKSWILAPKFSKGNVFAPKCSKSKDHELLMKFPSPG